MRVQLEAEGITMTSTQGHPFPEEKGSFCSLFCLLRGESAFPKTLLGQGNPMADRRFSAQSLGKRATTTLPGILGIPNECRLK